MFIMHMLFEYFRVLLQLNSLNATNETFVLLVIFYFLPLISQFGKGINHNARDNISEKQSKKYEIHSIIKKLNEIPLRH